ncbi:uncharacterized protein LOC127899892 [Citrus sinensis]|uniref:uncharacterized protein LOC127899892 n=1 Tax=Citrus sinensis TaxID=2711 RepID=UPI00227975D6|nr:uncharacterized protein LOC127899892 [Citrus sinensis]
MSKSILFWNVQGAASKKFYRAFATILNNYKPSIVVILEPRISGCKADDFIMNSGFSRSHRIEATGFSGGIWILWHEAFVIKVVLNHKQFVHMQIVENNNFFSWATAVYASPNPVLRRHLWVHLNHIAKSVQGPWIVGGDFNAIMYASERKGGSQYGSRVCKLFRQWFHSNKLHDLHFKGPRYTWARGNLYKRLDRVICNDNWFRTFTEGSVLHLPKVESDYRPLLARFVSEEKCKHGPKPFRFLAAWITTKDFADFVATRWNSNVPYIAAAQTFTSEVIQWNKDCFGNIFHKKMRLLARLGGIQRALEVYDSKSLHRLEWKLRREPEEVLHHEELLWLQKSRKE